MRATPYAEGIEGIDYFRVNGLKYPFTVKSPDPEEYLENGLTEEQFRTQIAYIKTYVTNVYNAALSKNYTTFKTLADSASFIDMYIIHEFFKNTDTGWSSFYMYKKPGGKLFAGPTWDFDLSAGLTRGDASSEGIYVADTVRYHSDHTSSELYISLMGTSGFKSDVIVRWNQISNGISQSITGFVAKTKRFQPSFQAEVDKWSGGNWIEQVDELESWLQNRILWLNTEWKVA